MLDKFFPLAGNQRYFYPALVADFASIAAGPYLLLKLARLPPQFQRRLFPRQLKHLVLADLLLSLTDLVFDLFNVADLKMSNEDRRIFCSVAVTGNWAFRLASYLFELHIATSFMCSLRRSRLVLSAIIQLLPWIWMVSAIIVPSSNFVSKFYKLDTWSMDGLYCASTRVDYIIFFVTIACFSASIIIYVVSSCHTVSMDSSSFGTQINVSRRTSFYLLNFLFTSLPGVVFFIFPSIYNDKLGFAILAALERSNGFANFVSYWATSKYHKKSAHMRTGAPGDHPDQDLMVSYHVEFDHATIIVYNCEAEGISTSETISANSSEGRHSSDILSLSEGVLTSSADSPPGPPTAPRH